MIQEDFDQEESSFENFHDQANEEESDFTDSDIEGNYGRNSKRGQNSNRRLIPIEFAKEHIQKIEEDMKRMHERHVKLMREMDENYRLIE